MSKRLILCLIGLLCFVYGFSDTNSSRGPEWLDGKWRFKGDIDTFFGVQLVSAVLTIDWKNQELHAVTSTPGKGGGTRISGHYKVYNGAIHVESEQLYIKIDYTNKRLEFGNGMYYEKEDNGPKPTPTPKGEKFVNTNKEQIITGGGWATPTNSRYADYKSYDLKIKGDRIVGYGSNFSNNFKSCDAPFFELTPEERKEQKLTDNQGRSYEMYVTRCKYIAYINGLTFYFNIYVPPTEQEQINSHPDVVTVNNMSSKINKKDSTAMDGFSISLDDFISNKYRLGLEFIDFAIGQADKAGNIYLNLDLGMRFRYGDWTDLLQFGFGIRAGVGMVNPYSDLDSDKDLQFAGKFFMPIDLQIKINIFGVSDKARCFADTKLICNVVKDKDFQRPMAWSIGLGIAGRHWEWNLYYKREFGKYTGKYVAFKEYVPFGVGTTLAYYFNLN